MPRARTHLSAVAANKSPLLEIRYKIYEYAFISRSGSIAEYAGRDNDQHLGVKSEVLHDLLLTCRQIFNKGYDFYFAKDTFFFFFSSFSTYSDLLDFLEDRGSKGRKVITSLALDLEEFFEMIITIATSHLPFTISYL